MDPQLKQRWIDALRSGEYEQFGGQLRHDQPTYDELGNEDGVKSAYCCLGVLCEIAGVNYSRASGLPERGDLNNMGLNLDQADRLTELNDGYVMGDKRMPSRSFNYIASYIERYL